jgi:hypothetical protein
MLSQIMVQTLSLRRLLFAGCIIGAASANLSSDVLTWTVSDTQEWAATAGFSNVKGAQAAIVEHNVNGKILLFVDVADLQDEFGVSSKMEAKMIVEAIRHLQDSPEETPAINGAYEGEGGLRLDFYEYRAMNRKQFYKSACLFGSAPRYAIQLVETNFAAHALPAEPIGWIMWIVLPEYWIWQHSDAILGGLPFGIIFVIVGGFFAKVGAVLRESQKGLGGALLGQLVIGPLVVEVICAVLAEAYCWTLWYIVPWFVNDALFWLAMYIAPLVQMANALGLFKSSE